MSFHGLKYGLTLLFVYIVKCQGLKNFMENVRPENSPVEVTAVFINCDIDDIQKYTDNEDTRFEREELFKHNALRNCDKKLALTMKLSSASASSADEYVPIEHVLDGSSKRRVRLLNPYVLRLRRDAPLEAYKLRFIETVSGLLATSNEQNHKVSKTTVDTEDSNGMEDWRTELVGMVEPRRTRYALTIPGTHHAYDYHENRQFSRFAENSETVPRISVSSRISLGASSSWRPPLDVSSHPQHANCSTRNAPKTNSARTDNISVAFSTKRAKRHEKNVVIEEDDSLDNNQGGSRNFATDSRFFKATNDDGGTSKNELITEVNNKIDSTISNKFKLNGNCRPQLKTEFEENDNIAGSAKEFALYEVETPMLWFAVHVHLFEKLSNWKGNTLWNDITKGVPVSIDDSNYILVPSEDVLDINNIENSNNTSSNFSAEDRNEGHRKVVVRVARALSNVMGDKFNVVNQASDKFLTMRHLGVSRAQVDLEARADDNQLVRVRIQIRECDSDLIKLAEKQEGGVTSEAEELPPRHTRALRLRLTQLAADLQHCSVYLLNGNDESVAVRDAVLKKGDQCYCVWHCDCVCYGDNPRLPCQEMSAARQDAAGLPLPPRRGARLARACLYSDVTTVNIVVVVIGVIGMLLFLGVLKGLLGLVWTRAGVWGLDWILEQPRRLDRYYEGGLRCRPVAYDDAGWPVHPDTGKRTVRVVSLPVEFMLNLVFFVAGPGLIVVDTLKYSTKRKKVLASDSRSNAAKCTKTFNSRHDLQGRHRRARRSRLLPRRWMTPEADYLSTTIWEKDTTAAGLNNLKSMFPLSHDELSRPPADHSQTSGSDSDLEDTAFVLMQMQKSTESLAKNQINSNTAGLSSETENMAHSQSANSKADLDQA